MLTDHSEKAKVRIAIKFACLVISLILISGCAEMAAEQAAQQSQAASRLKYLSDRTEQDRDDCAKEKSSDSDACLRYAGDLHISDACKAYYGQFQRIDLECTSSTDDLVNIVIGCKNGDQSSCVEIQHRFSVAEQQREAGQAAPQQSSVAALWAQAQGAAGSGAGGSGRRGATAGKPTDDDALHATGHPGTRWVHRLQVKEDRGNKPVQSEQFDT